MREYYYLKIELGHVLFGVGHFKKKRILTRVIVEIKKTHGVGLGWVGLDVIKF